jgi:hypothetical protein
MAGLAVVAVLAGAAILRRFRDEIRDCL